MATTAPRAPQPAQTDPAAEIARLRAALDAALEQQAAAAATLRLVREGGGDFGKSVAAIAESAARLCDGEAASLWLLDRGAIVQAVGWSRAAGRAEFGDGTRRVAPDDAWPVGRAIVRGETVHVPDVADADPAEWPHAGSGDPDDDGWFAIMRRLGVRSYVAVPLRTAQPGGAAVGALVVRRFVPVRFRDEEIALLESFADQAVIAIENARLFSELQDRNATLKDALEQQTATAEILRVIASSPTDLSGVLQTILAAAGRLCDADRGHIQQLDPAAPGTMRPLAFLNNPGQQEASEAQPLTPTAVSGAAILRRRTIHVPDLEAEEACEFAFSRERNRRGTGADPAQRTRTLLAAPLLHDGVPIGAINLRRVGVRPFTDAQVRLLETFADQAAIAIQNARLFQDLNDANATLKEALEQQTATSDILRVIASSPTELPTVLDEIGRHAVRLCDADTGSVWRYVGHATDLEASGEPLTLWGPGRRPP